GTACAPARVGRSCPDAGRRAVPGSRPDNGLSTCVSRCAVLPENARLRRSEDFRAVMRGGTKTGRRTLVVHALRPRAGVDLADTRAGFVVSKAVGNAVVRHRVTRRLRHLVRDRLGSIPDGATLVVRALP